MWSTIISLIGTHLLVPFFFLVTLGNKHRNKLTAIGWLILTLGYVGHIYFAGRWDWLGIYLRYALLAGLLLSTVRSYRNNRTAPLLPERSWRAWGGIVFYGLMSVVFLGMAAASVAGRFHQEEAVALQFPLKDGTYYVAHGGNIPIVNYHNEYLPQRFALDIVKMNVLGLRANGLYPEDLRRYAIFGDRLYSPCSGVVRKAVDGYPDRAPSDFANGLPPGTPAAGNHVVIACRGVDVYIAHIQQGTVQVQEGDAVDEGSWIGNVGNSGNTSEPHLHIHAEKDGAGVPITFNGRFLVRNSLVRSAE